MTKHLLIFVVFVWGISMQAQKYILDSITPTLGHLIDFEANTFKFVEDSPAFDRFFARLDSIYSGKKEKLHIFHIGGSHIQADLYPNKIRTYLQNMNEVSMAQRGFVFPYHLAHTNNPLNYRIKAEKELWQGYRCSIKKDSIVHWSPAGLVMKDGKPEAAKVTTAITGDSATRWKLVMLLFVQLVFVTMVYGPIAAFLVEMFPVRIRYTSMSLPYHIGNGIFGGLLPAVATYLVTNAQTGGKAEWFLEGLWYPIIVAAVSLVIGFFYLNGKDRNVED